MNGNAATDGTSGPTIALACVAHGTTLDAINAALKLRRRTAMPGTLPHTQNGFAQTAADQHFREEPGEDAASANEDPTTLKFEGKVSICDEDAGSDPYNRTGRFRRLVR
jgi:hypothetical protein